MFRLPSYDTATTEERETGIARTQALRKAASSDRDRWRDPDMHHAVWTGRTAALAHYVRPHERVFEFGAGVRSARAFLPESCTYAASDLTPHGPDTVVYDLNAAVLAPLTGFDVALLSGVIEYVHSLPRMVSFLASHFSAVVCSYAGIVGHVPDAIERRRYAGWFSDLSSHEFECLFTQAGFRKVLGEAWESQALFRFERHAGAGPRP